MCIALNNQLSHFKFHPNSGESHQALDNDFTSTWHRIYVIFRSVICTFAWEHKIGFYVAATAAISLGGDRRHWTKHSNEHHTANSVPSAVAFAPTGLKYLWSFINWGREECRSLCRYSLLLITLVLPFLTTEWHSYSRGVKHISEWELITTMLFFKPHAVRHQCHMASYIYEE